ncbi:MAG: hypothetical protein WAT09_09985 [Paracoccaceae bacterium]
MATPLIKQFETIAGVSTISARAARQLSSKMTSTPTGSLQYSTQAMTVGVATQQTPLTP